MQAIPRGLEAYRQSSIGADSLETFTYRRRVQIGGKDWQGRKGISSQKLSRFKQLL